MTTSLGSKLSEPRRRVALLATTFAFAVWTASGVGCGGSAAYSMAGCSGRASAVPASATVPPTAVGPLVRCPDGVALEPPPAWPLPVERAAGRGVVSLREPVGPSVVERLVASFFDAWQRGSLEALTALLTTDAGSIDGSVRGRVALTEGWQQRLQAHEYVRLAGLELVRPDRIERWSYDELAEPGAPPRPAGMRPGDIFVRAPVEVTELAGERVFGDVAVLVLRRERDALRISAYGEAVAADVGDAHGSRP